MTHGFASFSALMSCILSSTNICCCAASSCGAAEPHTCLFFPTHHGDAMGRRHGPAPHGLESDVISLEWRSLSWAFCHFYTILQYQRVQARALKQAGRHKREPLFLGSTARARAMSNDARVMQSACNPPSPSLPAAATKAMSAASPHDGPTTHTTNVSRHTFLSISDHVVDNMGGAVHTHVHEWYALHTARCGHAPLIPLPRYH